MPGPRRDRFNEEEFLGWVKSLPAAVQKRFTTHRSGGGMGGPPQAPNQLQRRLTPQEIQATRAALAQRQRQAQGPMARTPRQQQAPVPGAQGYQFNPRTQAALAQGAVAPRRPNQGIMQETAGLNRMRGTLDPRATQPVPQGRRQPASPAQMAAAAALSQGQMKHRAAAASPQRGIGPPTRQAPAQVVQRAAPQQMRRSNAGGFTDQLGISSLVGDSRQKGKRTKPINKRRTR